MRKVLFFVVILLLSSFYSKGKEGNEFITQFQKIKRIKANNRQLDSLLLVYKDSLSFAEASNSSFKTSYFNLIITQLYYKLGIYNNAIDYGLKSINGFINIKDTSFIIHSYTSVGVLYGELDDFVIAEEYFKKIENLALLSGEESLLNHNYINLGIMNLDKDIEKSITYFNKAEEFISKNEKGKHKLIGLSNNKAVAYKRLGNYSKSISILKNNFKSINIGHPYYATICSNIANNYLLLKQYDSTLFYINKALNNPSNRSYLNNYVNSYRVMTEAYINTVKTDSSLKYFKLYQQYEDSVVIKKKVENISKLKVIYEINKLLLDVENQKEEIEKYNTRIRNLSIGLILLIVVVITFFVFYKKLQGSYRKIVKESVNAMLIEKDNAELSHRIDLLENGQIKNKPITQTFSVEKGDDLFNQINDLFKSEKLYTDQEFSLNKLADKLDTNRTYISNIINAKTGDSFVTFINTYRVKEAKKLLIDDSNNNLTLDAIGKEAGFHSTSTFNRVFKAETGVTPSFYVKNTPK